MKFGDRLETSMHDALTIGGIARGLGAVTRSDWPVVRSSELFGLRYGKALVESSRRPGDVPVFGTNGITGSHDAALFEGPGVVIGRKGAGHLGVHWSDRDYWVIDTAYSLVPGDRIDLKYAYYLIDFVGLNHLKNGTSNPSLTRDAFGAQYFPVPSLPEQRAIAATLGALDDKIESNRQAVAVARQLMRAHYDAAPKQRVTASQVLTPVLGGTPKRDVADYWNGTVKWASAKDIAGAEGGFVLDTAETVSEEGIDSSAAKVMPAGTIVMTARGTVGALARLSEPMAFNQSCYGLRTRAGREATLLTALEASVARIKDSGHGTVFNTVNMATFDQIELGVPDDPGVDILLEDLSRKILQSMKENSRLAALRDALLPELLSGRVRVPAEGAEA